jgi:hypothetical protein
MKKGEGRKMRKIITLMLCILIVTTIFAALPMNARADEFTAPPANVHSDVAMKPPPKSSEGTLSIDGEEFAQELHAAVGDEFNSMIITFAECYGGGMMQDVENEFIKHPSGPISMTSGSKYNQESYSSWPSVGALKDDGYNYWSDAYCLEHLGIIGGKNTNPKESDAYKKAKSIWGWPGSPQQLTLYNGGDIILGVGNGTKKATSFHAILFAGNTTNRADYWNDIAMQYRMLIDSGYPAANIAVLYGNGSVPQNAKEPAGGISPIIASKANLFINTIEALKGKMNGEQLYIYFGDHGSPDESTYTQPQGGVVRPQGRKNSNNTFVFSPLLDYMIEALQSPDNTNGPYIELNVETTGTITSNWKVFFDDSASAVNGGDNTFPGGGQNASLGFPINPSAINLTGYNDVWLGDNTSTDAPITVQIYFSMGDIQTAFGSSSGVGGTVVPINKLALLALLLAPYVPYAGLALTTMIALVAAAVYVKRVKRRKEKQ